jgi:UPF0042 nucleotide-binding protein
VTEQTDPQKQLELTFFSFGFKYGAPTEVNLLQDVRFLPNPYWVDELRSRTGLEQDVADYVLKSDATKEYLLKLLPLVAFLITSFRQAGKKELRLGIGCTGGRHRSVAVVEALARQFTQYAPTVFHRDIEKDS